MFQNTAHAELRPRHRRWAEFSYPQRQLSQLGSSNITVCSSNPTKTYIGKTLFSNARPSIPCPTRFVHYAIQKIVWNWRSRLFGDLGVPNKTTLKFSRTLRDPCRAFKTHAQTPNSQTLHQKPHQKTTFENSVCAYIYIYIYPYVYTCYEQVGT